MSSIDRSEDFVAVGLFLSLFGEKEGDGSVAPPAELRSPTWKQAYAVFYDALAAGRSLRSFSNSLKATRDAFDGWVDSGRVGWQDPKNPGQPKPLQPIEQRVRTRWTGADRQGLWTHVSRFADLEVGEASAFLLTDVDAQSDLPPDGLTKTEGGRKVIISSVIERSPGLRLKALALHGRYCMVCNFNFGEFYGEWGDGYAEVHHAKPLSATPDRVRLTNAATDLAVVCANCHRMLHRKRHLVLTLDELRQKVSR